MTALTGRFLLFAGDAYYPIGGWDDLVDDFDTKEAAIAYAHARFHLRDQWWHVIDVEERREVASSGL